MTKEDIFEYMVKNWKYQRNINTGQYKVRFYKRVYKFNTKFMLRQFIYKKSKRLCYIEKIDLQEAIFFINNTWVQHRNNQG